jgi:hypothetical protein
MASSGGGGIPNERHAGQRVKPGQKYQNREAFKAHRNMKRAVRDVDAENDLRHRACQGVCRRCVQKARDAVPSESRVVRRPPGETPRDRRASPHRKPQTRNPKPPHPSR